MKHATSFQGLVAMSLIFYAIPHGCLHAQTETINNDPTLVDGLVSYWPLDEEGGVRVDAQGGNDLTENNGVGSTEGKLGLAADFVPDHSTSLSIADTDQRGLDIPGDYTFAAWIRPHSFPQDGTLFGKFYDFIDYYGSHADQRSYLGILYSYAIMPYLSGDGVNYVGRQLSYDFRQDEWQYVVMSYFAATGSMKLYVNGLEVSNAVGFPTNLFNSTATFFLGAYKTGAYGFYDGLMDEVGIWNRALTADEVVRLYNGGEGLPYGEKKTGASSVAFLPGIMASRLYTNDTGGEQKRWESVLAGDLAELGMNTDGTSKSTSLYTRDVLDDIRPITGLGSFGEAYQGWISFMDGLVADGTLTEWKALPYDWRLATDELFLKGKDMGGGNISYTQVGTVPYLLEVLEGLADRSPTSKVTIVAHSNGGLVAKNLIHYLEATHHPLLDKIDTLVLVASPQAGTPKALREVLHGIDMPAQQTLRDVVRFMPGAYGLLPSSHLMGLLDEPVVETAASVATLPLMQDMAGTNITTYSNLRKFLTGEIGTRTDAATLGYLHPNLLSAALLASSSAMHEAVDVWRPEHIRVIEVVGTGLWTPRGVAYRAYDRHTSSDTPVPSLRTEWLANDRGDGTVLAKSAESGESDETYYFGMNEYNAHEEANNNHMTVLSTKPVQELIRSHVLGGSDETPLYMNTTGATHPFPRFELRAYSPVDLHLYRGGMHTGVRSGEPATDLGRPYEAEIPNSYYEEWADVKYAGADLPASVLVVLDGTGEGTFTLELDRYDGAAHDGTYAWTDLPVRQESRGTTTIDAEGVPVLLYDFDGDGDTDARLAPGDTFEAWQAYDVSFAGLREAIRDAGMGKLLEAWFLARVKLAEELHKKGGKGSAQAAKVLLETIVWSAERQGSKALTAEDATTIAKLARALELRL